MCADLYVLTHWMPEPVGRELLLNGPLVQDDVDRDAPRGSTV